MKRVISGNDDLHGNVPDHSPVVLILVDVLNDLDFPGSQSIVRIASSLSGNIARLKKRCSRAGIPTIYVNDNHAKWRSDFTAVVTHCRQKDVPGRALVEPLLPSPDDYIVLKPRHSAFYSTPLDTLLSYFLARAVILAGITTDACILTTACEIHVRDLKLFVPSDCVAAINPRMHKIAMELMENSLGARTTTSSRLNLKEIAGDKQLNKEGRS